ncbi:MAG TPA: dynamin family protein [Acidimicrobiales bacterium]
MSEGGTIRETVDRALAQLIDELGHGPDRDVIETLRSEFAEPLRVAVAGRIKAGKSTLVNALLRQRVAPTDVGECTRFVTWYRHGFPERLEIVGVDGARRSRPLRTDGSLPPELGVDPAEIHHLEVFLGNAQLQRLTVIDTPGLASTHDERSAATRELLAIDRDSRAAVSDADVLLLVMAMDGRDSDDAVLYAFESQFDGLRKTALNAAAVLSKIDLIDEPGAAVRSRLEDVARSVAGRLRTPLAAVVPMATLLAETTECGMLTEDDVDALVALARLDEVATAKLLRTVDRFVSAEAPVPSSRRARLLERLDLHGVAIAIAHLRASGTPSLIRRLRDEAGTEAFRMRVLDGVSRNADVLKCTRLLTTLARVGADGASRTPVLRALETLWLDPALHGVRLERAAQLHSAGEAELPGELASELHALARGATGALPAVEKPALVEAVGRWRRFANSGRAGPAEREIADVMCRAYELTYERLAASG